VATVATTVADHQLRYGHALLASVTADPELVTTSGVVTEFTPP